MIGRELCEVSSHFLVLVSNYNWFLSSIELNNDLICRHTVKKMGMEREKKNVTEISYILQEEEVS